MTLLANTTPFEHRMRARYGFAGSHTAALFTSDLWPRAAYQSSCTWCRAVFYSTKAMNFCLGPSDGGPHLRVRSSCSADSCAAVTRLRAELDDSTARVAHLQDALAEALEVSRFRGEEVAGRSEDLMVLEAGIERIVRGLWPSDDVDERLSMDTAELFDEITQRIDALVSERFAAVTERDLARDEIQSFLAGLGARERAKLLEDIRRRGTS